MHKNGLKRITHIRAKVYNWAPSHTVTYAKYNSKLLGALTRRGDKTGGIRRMEKLHRWVKTNHLVEPYKLLFLAYLKISPVLQPRYVKIAGKMQPVAYGLMGENKRVTFGVKWAVKSLRDKHKTGSVDIEKLGQGLYEATRNGGELLAYKQG